MEKADDKKKLERRVKERFCGLTTSFIYLFVCYKYNKKTVEGRVGALLLIRDF